MTKNENGLVAVGMACAGEVLYAVSVRGSADSARTEMRSFSSWQLATNIGNERLDSEFADSIEEYVEKWNADTVVLLQPDRTASAYVRHATALLTKQKVELLDSVTQADEPAEGATDKVGKTPDEYAAEFKLVVNVAKAALAAKQEAVRLALAAKYKEGADVG